MCSQVYFVHAQQLTWQGIVQPELCSNHLATQYTIHVQCRCAAAAAAQGVATNMQNLVAALTQQQRVPRCRVALDLVLNCSAPMQAATATTAAVPSGSTAPARVTASCSGAPASSSTGQQEAAGAQAEALVQQLLRLVLTPKELSSESLMLPLLDAVAMAASNSWSGAKTSSSTSRKWGSDAQGSTAAAAAAALLAACTPSGRCLEVLLRTCQVGAACLLLAGQQQLCRPAHVGCTHTFGPSGTGCSSCQALVMETCGDCVGCSHKRASRLCLAILSPPFLLLPAGPQAQHGAALQQQQQQQRCVTPDHIRAQLWQQQQQCN